MRKVVKHQPLSAERLDARHAEAFRDMEADVRDLERMAHLSKTLAFDEPAEEIDEECARLVVDVLAGMVTAFRRKYYAAWDGKRAPA